MTKRNNKGIGKNIRCKTTLHREFSSFDILLIVLTVDTIEWESSAIAFGFLFGLRLLSRPSFPRSHNTLISYSP